MDCLVCHETTGKYKKFPAGCGHPAYKDQKFDGKDFKAVDLNASAQSVGKPGLRNCGACHFFGGGGDGIKHGDLNTTLLTADRNLDVHMSKKGAGFNCTACHTTINHDIAGRFYTERAMAEHRSVMPSGCGNRISCESCHGSTPHVKNSKLDHHTDKVSCQTCHIPAFARGGKSTMTWWDWSTAGKFAPDGSVITRKDSKGNPIYNSKKGDLKWEADVVPTYAWYNGAMDYLTMHDALPAGRPVEINRPRGDYNDPQARIFPFKYHRGRQVYDSGENKLVIPKLFGPKGSGAYWSDYDWQKAVEVGMTEAGEKFSGQIGFVETAMYWPVTHMVAPKEASLQCAACHDRNGRLASVSGFYLPGRDHAKWLDMTGWTLFILSIIGVVAHGFGRAVFRYLRSRRNEE